jgi:hypothetical protein
MKNTNLIYIALGIGVVGFLYMRSKKPKQVIKKGDLTDEQLKEQAQEDAYGESSAIDSGSGGGGSMGGGGSFGSSSTTSSPIGSGTMVGSAIASSSNSPYPSGTTFGAKPTFSIAPKPAMSIAPRPIMSSVVRPNFSNPIPLPKPTLAVKTNFLGFDGDMTNKTRKFDFSTDF